MPIKRIIDGLNEFHDNYFTNHREMFEHLSHGQTPEVLFITCSDSRIDPFLITQSLPGDLFVIRNIGNIIPPYGAANKSEGAGIEYAIQALSVNDVVVCGHSHCGAMKGMLQIGNLAQQMPLVYEWLKQYAEPTRRLIVDNYQDYPIDKLLKIAIEQNVLTQIENLGTYPIIRSRLHSRKLTLHAWIYEIETGEVFAYDADAGQFKILENRPFPVPNPLIGVHSK
ncbi:carbonic anhydrase [Calothrix sp. PCC 7507]|uniref:carbonic anhydrase n=1 Tax=Calothrix sp. PCC 7507 TaxID=99598 RepID=UPI00029F3DE5|nr:carbonic anhydrase [Calothrix sp. PCC 7507]AFY31584.1 Carbonate dehydratase [Calothrix sp. PCC 7507]